MRRMLWTLMVIAAVGLVVAGCGGSDKKSAASSGAATEASSGGGDVSAVLSAVKTDAAAQGPTKIAVDATFTVGGTPSGQFASFLSKPIHMTVDGATTGADVDATVALTVNDKPIKFGVISVGGKSFIQLDGKWFKSDSVTSAGSSLGTATPKVSTSGLDLSKITSAIGDPSKLFKDGATVSDDDVEGIKTDHVSGTLDAQGIIATLESVAKATGKKYTAPTAAEQKKVEDAFKDAKVDVWVGKDDHLVHKLAVDGTINLDTPQQGVGSVGIKLSVTSVPTDGVKVEAPADVRPDAELQAAALNLLGPFIGDLSAAQG